MCAIESVVQTFVSPCHVHLVFATYIHLRSRQTDFIHLIYIHRWTDGQKIKLSPWRRMGELRYSSTTLDLGTRWRWVVSFMSMPLYPRERAAGTHWIGGWVGPPELVWTLWRRKKKSCPCRESNTGRPSASRILTEQSRLLARWTEQEAKWLTLESSFTSALVVT
jgi:hypothetical protein